MRTKRSLFFFLLLGVTAACVSSAPDFNFHDGGPTPPTSETGPADARISDAGPCNVNEPFKRSPNQPFRNLNTSTSQVGASLSPDELTVYYDDGRKLFTATRTDIGKPFENAHPLPMEDGGCKNYGLPAVTNDEKRLFFQCSNDDDQTTSIRTMTRGERGQTFGNLQDVRFDLPTLFKSFPRLYESQGRVELWSSVTDADTGSRNGDQIYQLVSTDGGAGFGAATPRDDLNDENTGDSFAVLTPDGLQVYFASGRADIMNADIYVATRPNTNARFQDITHVDALSDINGDDAPNWISPDGCRLYYFSSRAGGAGGYDLYLAERPK
ncbi:hypothetical protein LZC95_28800 [Pendulispora brunnea]|uniref:Uncharacterized protein n=1 Tax=Pendulispora brunnea TaxID=2905690 RepID=A0ABZ2JVE3_9BACT